MNRVKKAVMAAVAALGFSASAAAVPTPVDLELSLVIDISGSISGAEYDLQMDGYADAFRQQSVIDDIVASANGIAVNAVFFASSASEEITFQHLQTETEVLDFADLLDAFARPFSGGTNVAAGMQAALDSILNNDFDGASQIIDVSGDGSGGTGTSSEAVRDDALAQGVDAINAIAIQSQSLQTIFENSVIGGTGSFALFASSFDEFRTAISRKIELEVDQGTNPMPIPGSMLLLLAGLVGLGVLRHRL
ncbi:hypothetical protein CCR85_02260 [Rhodothalassium salexigens]|uniref:DUF1194 domain-containing protein n=1 Tax=Rhodothalassium salexigens TaxID=1086 RepID=UPI0019142B45|nr:DUF1194 domain-containing protein [Rhodothalassium salexigens]MBK5910313.1 hypothetical protein [Rhodothalassium salexigens]MBK5921074.1 hypothetical protein [Rhodothalassium salexigens]